MTVNEMPMRPALFPMIGYPVPVGLNFYPVACHPDMLIIFPCPVTRFPDIAAA